jgi:hypothetical protein
MTAVPDAQVLTADWAQALAIPSADGVDRDLKKGVFPDQWLNVHMSILRHDQPRIAHLLRTEGIVLGQGPFEPMGRDAQASHALKIQIGGEAAGEQEPLRSTASAQQALEICKLEIVGHPNLRELERKLIAKADFLMHDEADVQPKWALQVAHM